MSPVRFQTEPDDGRMSFVSLGPIANIGTLGDGVSIRTAIEFATFDIFSHSTRLSWCSSAMRSKVSVALRIGALRGRHSYAGRQGQRGMDGSKRIKCPARRPGGANLCRRRPRHWRLGIGTGMPSGGNTVCAGEGVCPSLDSRAGGMANPSESNRANR